MYTTVNEDLRKNQHLKKKMSKQVLNNCGNKFRLEISISELKFLRFKLTYKSNMYFKDAYENERKKGRNTRALCAFLQYFFFKQIREVPLIQRKKKRNLFIF